MAERKKPDFSIQTGYWIDPNYLPERLRYDLDIELRKSKLEPAQQLSMIEHANELAQRPNTYTIPIGREKDQLQAVEDEARRFLAALNMLSPQAIGSLSLYTKESIFEHPSPFPFEMVGRIRDLGPDNLLGEAWEWVDALTSAVAYANSRLVAPKTDGPKLSRPRWLVANLARHHVRLTDVAPPSDPASWFFGFVSALADHLNLRAGPDIVKTGIAMAMKPYLDDSADVGV